MDFDIDKGFKVYRNLNKNCWTILAYNEEKKGWRVFKYLDNFVGLQCKPVVNKKTREKIVKDLESTGKRTKTPHAFIECQVICNNILGVFKNIECYNYIMYDPYKSHMFFINDDVCNEYKGSEMCLFSEEKVIIKKYNYDNIEK